MPWRFDYDDFQGRANVGVQQVTAVRGPVRRADNHVGMQLRMACVVVSDVPHERQQFDLLLNLDLLVVLFLYVEELRIRAFQGRRVQQQPRSFDAVPRDDDLSCLLDAPLPLTVVVDACREAGTIDFDAADHGQIADLGTAFDCTRNPGDQHALLGIRAAADDAKPAVDARVR